jgi:hypothetical protein
MIIKKITPDEQRRIVETLYYSTDSIHSAEKFNKEYGDNMGHHIGTMTITLNDFAKMLLKTQFHHVDIHKAIIKVTGVDLDFDKLY